MNLKNVSLTFLLILFVANSSQSQSFTDSIPALRYETIVPQKDYQAGGLFRFFFGDHWRDLWTTPITVPVIDLNKFAGGLTPVKTGGGFQTKSLHFKGADGKYYKFRSINKDPARLLPEDLQLTFVSDILFDQISTSHPIAAVIVAPMLNAVGVLNAEPEVIILPDDPVLGEYREIYKNELGTIEENPKDDTEHNLIFAGADKIINDYEIFEELDKDDDHQADGAAYLKARLMDVFLGDWDRHVGQWKWARFKDGKKETWKPIPRDRDQAFSRYDGLFPWIVSLSVPQIEVFEEDYPQVNDLTWSGRHLDRRILMSVKRDTWDSVTVFLKSALTDDVIENAVRKMPQSWYNKQGTYLTTALKQRRDNLTQISAEYYEMINAYISVKTSDKNEFAEIQRVADDTVKVTIYKRNKESGEKEGHPFYDRTFNSAETNEIRIFLQDGDDKAIVSGRVNSSIPVRIIGGDGKDELIDSSCVAGYFLDVLPIPDAENLTYLYDRGKKTTFVEGSGTVIDKSKTTLPKPYKEGDNVNEKYEPPVRDWGYDWKPGQWFAFSSDDGLQIGGGPILIKHGFRADPYLWRMSAMAGYATTPGKFRLEYNVEFYNIIKKWRTKITLGKNELAYTRFYGLGNERVMEKKVDNNFYRVAQEFYLLGISMDRQISDYTHISFCSTVRHSNLEEKNILATEDFKGLGKNLYLTVGSGIQYDSRDNEVNTKDGFFVSIQLRYVPVVFDNHNKFSKALFDGRYYYTPQNLPLTIAARVYTENTWGNYYIFDAPTIGGAEFLRGYTRERFAGDASLFSALEMRAPVFKQNLFIPGVIGISLHAESGRIFYDKEDSQKWHASYGGGFWISYLRDSMILNLTASQSAEALQFYFSTGFMF